jgi:hypothetical protein
MEFGHFEEGKGGEVGEVGYLGDFMGWNLHAQGKIMARMERIEKPLEIECGDRMWG